MTPQEITKELDEVESRLERLRIKYEQYFAGYEKMIPFVQRKDVDRRFAALHKEQFRNAGLRFRFNTLVQRFTTYQTHWGRTLRRIEEGTYKRDVLKAQKLREELAAREAADRARAERPPAEEEPEEIDAEPEEYHEPAPAPAPRPRVGPITLNEDDGRFDSLPPGMFGDHDDGPALNLDALERHPAPRTPSATPPRPAPSPSALPPRAPASPTAPPPRAAPPSGDGARQSFSPFAGVRGPTPAPIRGSSPNTPATPGAPAAPRPTAAPARPAPAPAPRPAASSDDPQVRALWQRFVEARKQTGESVDVRYESIAKQVRETLPKLNERYQGADVKLDVAIKDGKAVLRPVVTVKKK
ncbi:MAG: MXAN_5187 C-terminal domain-containing protein [Polyangiales bacterium]